MPGKINKKNGPNSKISSKVRQIKLLHLLPPHPFPNLIVFFPSVLYVFYAFLFSNWSPENFSGGPMWSFLSVRPSLRPSETITANLDSRFFWNLVYSFFGSNVRDAQGRFFLISQKSAFWVQKIAVFCIFWGF